MIEAAGYTKFCGSLQVVRSVSFDVAIGEIIGTLGPNDAGKATTLETMKRLRGRDGCRVSIFGLDPSKSALGIKSRAGV